MYELLVIFHCVAHLQVRQFYEVVCYTLCATLGFNKENCFSIARYDLGCDKSLSPGCMTEHGVL